MPLSTKRSRSHRIATTVSMAAVGVLFGAQAFGAEIVARVQEREVLLEELDRVGGRAIYDASQQLYESRVRALYQLLSEDLLTREAKVQRLSVDRLLEANVDAVISAVTEDDVETLLKTRAGGDAGNPRARKEALAYLTLKRRADAKRAYVTKLFAKYGVRVALDPPPAPPAEEVQGPLEPALGDPAAPVTIIAFSDYRCPYCRDLSHTLTRLLEQFPDDVRIVYRHFPVHPNADQLAEAALCAADQGRFAQYHDLLFDAPTVDAGQLDSLAAQAGLDAAAFSSCLETKRHRARIEEDFREGQRLQIQGTPTLFVNGLRLRGAQSLQRLSAQVREALARNRESTTAQASEHR